MDKNTLNQLFSATLSQDQNIRVKVELTLKEYEKQDNFLATVLNVICSNDIDMGARHAASIYFKNRVRRGWDSQSTESFTAISENDKQFVKQNIIQSLSQVPQVIISQLAASINTIIIKDFPKNWSDLLQNLTSLMSSNDFQQTYVGILVLNELVKVYQYRKDDREQLNQIVEYIFPYALKVAQNAANTDTLEAAEIIRLTFKIYCTSIQCCLFPCLQDNSSIIPWGTVLLQIVEKQIPNEALPETKEEREKYLWWKAKKWAYKCLNRIFSKYGRPSSLKEYTQFSESFTQNFAPIILKAYLKQTELYLSGQFISSWAMHLIAEFYTECVKPKVTWQILKPQVEPLIKYFIFPLLCFNKEEQEIWEDDPVEYVRKRFDIMEDFKSPKSTAEIFLITLVKDRSSRTFMPILEFINGIIESNKQPQDINAAYQKDGAMTMIGILADATLRKKSPVKDQMGQFLVNMFSDFSSPYIFLRVKMCELINDFENLELTDEQAKMALQGVMECMQNNDLLLKVSAANALNTLLQYESIQTEIGPIVGMIMQELLKLLNEIDMDTLTQIMNKMVELFADQLAPYAVQLCEQLRDSLLRMIGEANVETANETAAENKVMASLGILRTISTMILALEQSPEILSSLECIIYPVIHYVFEKEIIDLYDEVLEIVDGFIYYQKKVSPTLWNVFNLIYVSFKSEAIDYIREMFPSFDDYISFGNDVLNTNKEYQNMMFDIIKTVIETDTLEISESIYGYQLMESMLLNCRGCIDNFVPEFISFAQKSIESNEELPNGYYIICFEVIINALYYNPILTLGYLEHIKYTSTFFSKWFEMLDKFKRVHDKKLCVVALLSIIEIPFENIPKDLQAGWEKIMYALMNLFETYPKACENLKKLEEEEESFDDKYGKLLEDDENEEEEEIIEGEDENVIDDEEDDYLQMLASAAAEEFGKYDTCEELEEEIYFQTPLNDVDIYIKFQEIMQVVSQSQVQSYQLLTQSLNGEHHAFLNNLMEIANKNRVELAQKAAQPSS